MRWLLALALLSAPAQAADPHYCRPYARGALTMAIGKMSHKEQAKLTFPKMFDVLSRLQLTCGNLEEDFTETDAIWLVDILDQIQREPADQPSPVAGPPVAPKHQGPAAGSPALPGRATPSSSKNDPAAICKAAHRKVVFTGKSWHCVG